MSCGPTQALRWPRRSNGARYGTAFSPRPSPSPTPASASPKRATCSPACSRSRKSWTSRWQDWRSYCGSNADTRSVYCERPGRRHFATPPPPPDQEFPCYTGTHLRRGRRPWYANVSMQLSDVYLDLGQDLFGQLVRSISIGKLKTYQIYEGFKVRAHLQKVNTEALRKAAPRFWARVGERDEDFAKDLGQAVLVSHLDMITAVLDFLGVPHEN